MRQAAIISAVLLLVLMCSCGSGGADDESRSYSPDIDEIDISDEYNSASGKYMLESSEGTSCMLLGLPEEIHIEQNGYNIRLTDKNGEVVVNNTDLCVYECGDLVPEFNQQCDAVIYTNGYGSLVCHFTIYTNIGVKVGCSNDIYSTGDEYCQLIYSKEIMGSYAANIPDTIWVCTRLLY